MRSTIAKRSVAIRGHKTSLSLEPEFWIALREVAAQRQMPVSELITEIDAQRMHNNLSSAVRLFVLGVYKNQLTEFVRPQPRRSELVV
jgi:predicted DNA-binding ribbon-helix-helix protein